MGRKKSKSGHCICYSIPPEKLPSFIGKGAMTPIPDEYKVRELRRLTVASMTAMMEKYYSAYIYASWHGKNAESMRIVDTSTGEILEEKSYFTRSSILTLSEKLESQKLAMFVY